MTDKQWKEVEANLDELNASFEYHKANDKKVGRYEKK
jgi:hypothetical protein